VGYVHLVFTMPEPLARLALVNKRMVYALVFQAAAATLLQVAANPKRLGAAIVGLMGDPPRGHSGCSTIHTSIAWCGWGAWRQTARDGSMRAPASSCRFPSSESSFAA